jgi:hypothetical protein
MLQFGKPECPVSSILAVVRGTADTRRGFLLCQSASDQRIGKNHNKLKMMRIGTMGTTSTGLGEKEQGAHHESAHLA